MMPMKYRGSTYPVRPEPKYGPRLSNLCDVLRVEQELERMQDRLEADNEIESGTSTPRHTYVTVTSFDAKTAVKTTPSRTEV